MKSAGLVRPIVRVVLALALGALLLTPTSASAMTKFQGGPTTNLNPAGDTIHIALSNFPATGGLYVVECLRTATAGSLATSCDSAHQLWVSYDANASVSPMGDVALKVSGVVQGKTCGVDLCGIFLTYDHTKPTDRTEDQLINISFSAGMIAVVKPLDVITAKINNVAMSGSVPGSLPYHATLTISATSASGSLVTIKSSTPDCTVTKNVITALKASGYCDFALTSLGNLSLQAVTSHYPFALSAGVQSIRTIAGSAKIGARYYLPAKSNFGNVVTYVSTTPDVCTVAKTIVTGKKVGACVITAAAPAQASLWGALSSKVTLKII